ncbi:hypothetical protein SDC9_100949 [bioreactor metagenome]|uniref:DUF4352 domain-containing protein n=1 Tax=bioreactor metagenome TaxID=1076179 RepID=A0A645ALQ8_9ZZZZ
MKKTAVLFFAALLSFFLCACSGESDGAAATPTPSPTPNLTLSEDEMERLYTDADAFAGRTVTISGQIFTGIERDSKGVYFQIWADPKNADKNTIVEYKNTDAALEKYDYVKVEGKVVGTYEGENAFGVKITALQIEASAVVTVGYIEAVSPTLRSVNVMSVQEQYGYQIDLQKVEFADAETRIYLSVTNGGKSDFSVFSFDVKLVQKGKQFEEQPNYAAHYPEIQTGLLPGITTEGVIVFPAIEQSNFKLVLKASSGDPLEVIAPFTFNVVVKWLKPALE